MVLHQVRLKCYLPHFGESMQMPSSQGNRNVTDEDIRQHREKEKVRVQLIVIEFSFRKNVCRPSRSHAEENSSNEPFDQYLLHYRKFLNLVQPFCILRKVESKDHAKEGGPVVKCCAKMELFLSSPGCSHNRALAKEEKNSFKNARNFPNKVDYRCYTQKFDPDSPFGVVDARPNSHGDIDRTEVESVERADVVEDVGIVVAEAQKEDEKI
mmetsp:Transcript_15176/g.29844  ORF Transcript_15176/g.29844 Transcript_15176/m.29844 type:complete len:211 (+) Transcript_15176:2241-2873(+)